MKRAVLPIIAVFALSACSSITPERASDPQNLLQAINVSTPAVSGAKCVFKTSDYSQTLTTPATLQAMPTNRDITYTCDAKGFTTARGVIAAQNNAWNMTHFANKMMPGTRYDMKEGEEFSYPESVEIEMIPDSGVAVAHQDAIAGKDSMSRAQLDADFQQMLAETSWAVNGGKPPVHYVNAKMQPVKNVQNVQPVKTAPANATPQDGDEPQPLNLMQ